MSRIVASHTLFKAGSSRCLCQRPGPGISAPALSTLRASSPPAPQSPNDQTLQTFQMSSGQQTRPPPTPGEAREASILAFSSFLPWSSFCSALQGPLLSARTGYPQGTHRHPCTEGSAEPSSPLTVSCARLVAALLPVPLATARLGTRPPVSAHGLWPGHRLLLFKGCDLVPEWGSPRPREAGFFLLVPPVAMRVCTRPRGPEIADGHPVQP